MNPVPPRWQTVALLAVVVALLFGCGGVRQAAQNQKRANQLKAIGLAYHNCNDDQQRGPGNADELRKYLEGFEDAYKAVKAGDIVVLWGARIPADFPQGTPNTVLGYDKAVPANGGTVLMGDGSTRTMTAAEFAAAPKPQQAGK
jgi:hypothetical protein